VAGLEAGADDYVTKPFGSRELVARVRGNLRRCYELTGAKSICFGHIEMDPEAVTLKVKGVPISVPLAEFRLLEYLVRNPGRTFSRMHLLKMIRWGSRVVKPRVVDVYVKRIRAKIEVDKGHPEYLRTVRRLGYCFHPPALAVPSKK
jgi:two-component system, OmpR family, response regulator RegX3